MQLRFLIAIPLATGCFGTVPPPDDTSLADGSATSGADDDADDDDGPGQEAGGDDTAGGDDGDGTGGSSPGDDSADDSADDTGDGGSEGEDEGEDGSSESGEPPPPMPVIPGDALLALEFNESAVGPYSVDDLAEDWLAPDWENGVSLGHLEVVEDGHTGRALRIHYPEGVFGPESGAQWHSQLGDDYEELYVAFWVRFGGDFDFVKGGTLVGLTGGPIFHSGTTPGGIDGWHYRGRWIEDGIAGFQVYHMDQTMTYGDQPVWSQPSTRFFEPGVWHHVQHRVVMNTPGEADGILEAWFDGQLAFSRNDLRFRNSDSLAIDALRFSTTFGGGDDSYSANKPEYVDLDDFVIADSPIVTPPR